MNFSFDISYLRFKLSRKIIAVIGPTASGKTSLAIEIAKKFNGELVNADSRQIYKYLDIGTAKGEVEIYQKAKIKDQKYRLKIKKLDTYTIEGVPIHLINIVKPDEILTLAEYQKLAFEVILDIQKRGKLPILVGGTGLYIDAIVKGYKIPPGAPDWELRQKLEQNDIKKLQGQAIKDDPDGFKLLNESDRGNPRRLIRLIEKARKSQRAKAKQTRLDFEMLLVTPRYLRAELYKKINQRVVELVKAGVLDEVKQLLDKGYKFDTPAFSAIAYPLAKSYFEGKITKEEFVAKWQQYDRNYARRQETWFKRYKSLRYDGLGDLYKKLEVLINHS